MMTEPTTMNSTPDPSHLPDH
ncbi:MAG: hypothetical protein JWO11_1319, partial [Nocardioides sp.]|nr:hypothetical protein [Nocardioides sp.]